MIRRRALLAGTAGLGIAVPPARASDALAAIDRLRQGGFVIFFRHGETGRVSYDRPTAVMGDCSTQRNLDDVGRGPSTRRGPDAAGGYTRLVSVMPGDWTRVRSVTPSKR